MTKLSDYINLQIVHRLNKKTGVIKDAKFHRGKDSALGVRLTVEEPDGNTFHCQPGEIDIIIDNQNNQQ